MCTHSAPIRRGGGSLVQTRRPRKPASRPTLRGSRLVDNDMRRSEIAAVAVAEAKVSTTINRCPSLNCARDYPLPGSPSGEFPVADRVDRQRSFMSRAALRACEVEFSSHSVAVATVRSELDHRGNVARARSGARTASVSPDYRSAITGCSCPGASQTTLASDAAHVGSTARRSALRSPPRSPPMVPFLRGHDVIARPPGDRSR